MSRRLIIGCGNLDRGDDGAGVLVVRRLRELGVDTVEHTGDGLSLIDLWSSTDDVILIDATRSGAPAGEITEWDAIAGRVGVEITRVSTHAFGAGEGLELARSLGRLPASLTIYGIEGSHFTPGTPPCPAVLEAVENVVDRINRPMP